MLAPHELKASYFRQAVANLQAVERQTKTATLFDAMEAAE